MASLRVMTGTSRSTGATGCSCTSGSRRHTRTTPNAPCVPRWRSFAAVNRLSGTEPLQVRIGIATGPVVVGESGAGDASVPSAAVGETPNVAARLLALAGPDQIVIAPSTHRLLGNTFEIEDLGDHTLKGIDGPVRARRIRGLARSESRFDATRSSRYTPFVGREHEVALLLARWEHAREGEGQVVLLAGEPGIGKSRITQVLRERLADTPHLRLQYQCSPYHSGSAFHPLIEQLARAAGFERDDTPERKLDKLEAMLALSAEELPTIAPLFAALLSLPIDRYPSRMLSPQKHKELTIAALVDQPVRLGKRQPVLMICEDAHWIDPSTLETMALMVERIRHAAILLVITCRPEFVPLWTGHGNVTLLHLNRLSKRHGAAMTDRLTGGKALPDEVLTQILERTDGVPLFVEELTKAVLEAGFLHDAGGRWELSGPLPPLAIPSTLQDSLMARLDRLAPPIKDVAQIGACIGREFDHELLAAVAPMSAGDLHDALDKLVASGLIFCQGSVPEAIYSFKHALVQDVAYDGLLKSRRQQIHARIARSLVTDFKERAKARARVARAAPHARRVDRPGAPAVAHGGAIGDRQQPASRGTGLCRCRARARRSGRSRAEGQPRGRVARFGRSLPLDAHGLRLRSGGGFVGACGGAAGGGHRSPAADPRADGHQHLRVCRGGHAKGACHCRTTRVARAGHVGHGQQGCRLRCGRPNPLPARPVRALQAAARIRRRDLRNGPANRLRAVERRQGDRMQLVELDPFDGRPARPGEALRANGHRSRDGDGPAVRPDASVERGGSPIRRSRRL